MPDLFPENEIPSENLPENPPENPQARRGDRIESASSQKRDAAIALPNESSLEDPGNPLFPSEQCKTLGDEWQSIQASFVDAPRVSVQKADALVKKTVGILETSFAEMHNSLEQNWEKDRDVSTEDLRLALRNYRSFFQRLLSV